MSENNYTEELPEGIFTINFKKIKQCQLKDPSLLTKYDMGTYQKGSFCGGSHIYLNLIMCEDNIVIPIVWSIIEKHTFHKHH